jgi:hypothetical protein
MKITTYRLRMQSNILSYYERANEDKEKTRENQCQKKVTQSYQDIRVTGSEISEQIHGVETDSEQMLYSSSNVLTVCGFKSKTSYSTKHSMRFQK